MDARPWYGYLDHKDKIYKTTISSIQDASFTDIPSFKEISLTSHWDSIKKIHIDGRADGRKDLVKAVYDSLYYNLIDDN